MATKMRKRLNRVFGHRFVSGLILLVFILGLTACGQATDTESPSANPPGSPSGAVEHKGSGETLGPNPSETETLEPGAGAEPPADSDDKAAIPLTQVKVLRVVDGDTLEIELRGKEKLRLIGVNTPETHHPSKPVEEYGPEAEAFTTAQLTGQTVYIEFDVQERDNYGRLLGYVWLAAPLAESEEEIRDKMFNAKLLTEGYAQVMTVPPNVKYAETFRKLQDEARQSGKGLWGNKEQAVTGTPNETGNGNSAGGTSSGQTAAKGPNGETIKGNINSKGEKIYHLPGGQYYDQTVPEAWFFTEEEAQAAGFRPSKR